MMMVKEISEEERELEGKLRAKIEECIQDTRNLRGMNTGHKGSFQYFLDIEDKLADALRIMDC